MTTSGTAQFVRLRIDMVVEITDPVALTGSALESVAAEYGEPGGEQAEERLQAEEAVREDGAEALASLVDPFDLVGAVPGVELSQASWSSELVGPDAAGLADVDEWDLDDDEGTEGDEGDEGTEDGKGDDVDIPHNG